jgi:hypothetical protein
MIGRNQGHAEVFGEGVGLDTFVHAWIEGEGKEARDGPERPPSEGTMAGIEAPKWMHSGLPNKKEA